MSANAHGQVFLIALPMMSGWGYRVDYPYYSWAETIVRPPVRRRDFKALIAHLNELEQDKSDGANGRGHWILDKSEMTSAIKFRNRSGALCPSALPPEVVAEEMRAALAEAGTANSGAAQSG